MLPPTHLESGHGQVEVEVAGGRHHEPLHVVVEEDLLDFPPGLGEHLNGQLRCSAGRHRALQAAEEGLERVGAARVGNCQSVERARIAGT